MNMGTTKVSARAHTSASATSGSHSDAAVDIRARLDANEGMQLWLLEGGWWRVEGMNVRRNVRSGDEVWGEMPVKSEGRSCERKGRQKNVI